MMGAWPASSVADAPTLSHSAKRPAAEMRLMASSRRASCSCVAWPSASSAAKRCVITPSRRSGEPGPKRAKIASEIAGADALAAHAGVDLEMDGHGAGLRSGGACGGEQARRAATAPTRPA